MHLSTQIRWAVSGMTVFAVLLFAIGVLRNHSLDYWYLPYNLLLAVIPLLFAVSARRLIRRHRWRHWTVLCMLVLWLVFLPNSFYIVTDFIHLPETWRVDIVQDVVMLMQFSLVGLFFGFYSLFIVHKLYREFVGKYAGWFVGSVLFLCSFAIYLGRVLRWNSWDIIANPVHLLGDVVAIISNPTSFPEAMYMMGSFFGMLVTLYWMGWCVVQERTKRLQEN